MVKVGQAQRNHFSNKNILEKLGISFNRKFLVN